MFRAGEKQSLEELGAQFADMPPPLAVDEARVEAARCLFCFDAPCTRACPTHIDVPRFIRQVLHRDEIGAARTILDANIFGGSCARACPTEVLCEGACVDQMLMKAPVQIGRLQRFACDIAAARDIRFFEAGPPTGKRVAVVGSGPAGLSCAHELRRLGHDVIVYEARPVPGGLDTLGIAAYKIPTEFALAEIEQVRRIGIAIELGHRVMGDEVRGMLGAFDAVFLGIGLGRTAPLSIEGEDLEGVWESLDFIFQTHTRPFTECVVGRNVVVIGAGNTAIDVATAARRLGAETVTIAYRRSEALIPAFAYEYELAKSDGVRFEWFAQPVRIIGDGATATGVEFLRTELEDPRSRSGGVRTLTGSHFVLVADMVVKALGQEPLVDLLASLPELRCEQGRLMVDRATGATSVPGLFAGGDCLRKGGEVVDAVQDGKIAARGIHARLDEGIGMIDLSIEFCGVKAPNPFWLASGPPTNSEYQVRRAFDAGWGGAVWKTLAGEPIVNVSSRYGAVDYDGRKVMGLNNIELITDRTLEVNLKEIARVKKAHSDRALFVSLMVESTREAWHEITKQTQDAGADGIELNFGCPHGMSERGMGSAVGQVPDYTCMITEWVKEVATIPVMVKLTPNVSDVAAIGRAAVRGGADAISLINTINSIMGVDLDTLAPKPAVRGYGSHGGYCGPAVKPVALNMVAAVAADPAINTAISGIGGIQAWQDAVEFLLLGASSVQVCTAVMHYGFRIVEHLKSGMEGWMREKGYRTIADFVGRSVPRIKSWGDLDLNYKIIARIDQEKCIHCGLCYIACEDGCHQSIRVDRLAQSDYLAMRDSHYGAIRSGGYEILPGAGDGVINVFTIKEDTCVGCNMCSLVCPVEGCIMMQEVDTGRPPMSWNEYQAKLARGEVAPIQPPQHV